jgi:TolB-like protein/Tfp pilus assembly protein PilF
MTDLRARLQAALGAHYVIEREIGGGGMGRVYLVRDESLGRRVVVKVLPPTDGADVSIERFKREIQFVARLQHAHIVPLLLAGEAAGFPYYVMPFVDGESLRARIQRGTVPIAEIVSLLKDVARALAYAHEQGVVHRDIKPDNVLVSGGAAVVADFGIAKALSAARTEAGATLTSEGTSIGTPAYMAPEQATGDPDVNHRADIYSFGCLAYELVAGEPPFPGSTPHRVIAAHITDTAPSVLVLRADCPNALAQLIARCLEKDPAKRPQSAREILDVLDSVATPTGPTGSFVSARGRRRWPLAAAAIVAVVAIATALWLGGDRSSRPTVQTLTVLPFVAIGGDSAHAYLVDGISEELATTLANTPGVRVVGRTAANRFRGRRDIDVRAVGESLGVALVIQGSVRRTGDNLRVLAQLTDARTGEDLWADDYQRRPDDLLAVRDEIARGVLQKLTGRSTPVVGSVSGAARGSDDAEAYDLYLRAVYLLRRRSIGPATEYFERAIARDGRFARAHAGLSTTLALYPYFTGTKPGVIQDRLVQAASRALELDSLLSEPHTSLGLAHMHAMRWNDAEREHRLAVTLDPSDHEAHVQYGRLLLYMGLADSALAEFRRARAVDPYSSLYSAWIAATLWISGKGDEAKEEMRRASDLDSLNGVVLHYGSRILLESGDTANARLIAERMPKFPPWTGSTMYVIGQLGDRARVDSVRRSLTRTRPWFSGTAIAYAALGVGDTTAAMDALERATRDGEFWPGYFPLSDRPYDAIRQSARFQALVRGTGLDLRAIQRAGTPLRPDLP